MLMPKSHRVAIYTKLFQDGVCVAKKDKFAKLHDYITIFNSDVKVPNLHVIKAMQSLTSRGYVKQTFCWRHFYWTLTDEGIQYLRDFLHLPAEIVPSTLRRAVRIVNPGGATASSGRGRGRPIDSRSEYRRKVEGARPAYERPRKEIDSGASWRKPEFVGEPKLVEAELRGGYTKYTKTTARDEVETTHKVIKRVERTTVTRSFQTTVQSEREVEQVRKTDNLSKSDESKPALSAGNILASKTNEKTFERSLVVVNETHVTNGEVAATNGESHAVKEVEVDKEVDEEDMDALWKKRKLLASQEQSYEDSIESKIDDGRG